MHGGCIATLIDVIGTVAIATVADRSGVSLSITVNYLSPGPVGGAVEIESTVAKSGKQNAVAAVELRDAATGALVAFGTHTKAMVPQSDLGPLWALANALELQTQQTQQQGREARSRGGGSLPLLSKL
jgi:acyl-coenzyme A thioesterase 13